MNAKPRLDSANACSPMATSFDAYPTYTASRAEALPLRLRQLSSANFGILKRTKGTQLCVPFLNPAFRGAEVVGLTAVEPTTARLLQMYTKHRLELRQWIIEDRNL